MTVRAPAIQTLPMGGSGATWKGPRGLGSVAAMNDNPLGEFLRARRERVDPATVGLRALGSRRTPGLRREEVAALAGISVEYLVRLERGRDRHPSPSVVTALTSVLQLDADGRAHLDALADPRAGEIADVVDDVSDLVDRLIGGMSTPTIVTNSVLDLIAVNTAGEQLHRGIGLSVGDNMARELFLRPQARDIYVEFERVASETVGNLRSMSGRGGVHPRLEQLVGELSVASPEFARLWAVGEVAQKTNGTKVIEHPDLGRLELEWSTLQVAAVPGQLVVAYQAVPGTRAVNILTELGSADQFQHPAQST